MVHDPSDSPDTPTGKDNTFFRHPIGQEAIALGAPLHRDGSSSASLTDEKAALITRMLEEVNLSVEDLILILGVQSAERTPHGLMVNVSDAGGEAIAVADYLRSLSPSELEAIERMLEAKAKGKPWLEKLKASFLLLFQKKRTLEHERLIGIAMTQQALETQQAQDTAKQQGRSPLLQQAVAVLTAAVARWLPYRGRERQEPHERRGAFDEEQTLGRRSRKKDRQQSNAPTGQGQTKNRGQNIVQQLIVSDIVADKAQDANQQKESQERAGQSETVQTLPQRATSLARDLWRSMRRATRRREREATGQARWKQGGEDGSSSTRQPNLQNEGESRAAMLQAKTESQIEQGTRETVRNVILADIIGDKKRMLGEIEKRLRSGKRYDLLQSLKEVDPSIRDITIDAAGRIVVALAGDKTPANLEASLEKGLKGKDSPVAISHQKMRKGEGVHAQGIKGENNEGDWDKVEEETIPLKPVDSKTMQLAEKQTLEIKTDTHNLKKRLEHLDILHDSIERQQSLQKADNIGHFQQHGGVHPLEAALKGTNIATVAADLQKSLEKQLDTDKLVTPGPQISPKDIKQELDPQSPNRPITPEKTR